MTRQSAGLLLYRRTAEGLEVLLVHPGGPYWAGRDDGAWSIPKGEVGPGETPLAAALREFTEETGATAGGEFIALAPVKRRGGKIVHAFAVHARFDPAQLRSNTFEIEWPPRSGRRQTYPEVDRAAWFALEDAYRRITKGQRPLLDELRHRLARG